ncbi:MAG: DUF2905 domain-containing protein [Acidobacteria bacterium]|nr:MAG: DUF2905 domain-containing protein [Acidobacteriota bacterium]REK08781.1 MAG: DUF2905 domain-containing protein [Acidobacteriota bacterium]
MGSESLGKLLVLVGAALALLGVAMVYGRVRLGRLPGDLQFGGEAARLYLPLTTCLLLSGVATLLLWLWDRWR